MKDRVTQADIVHLFEPHITSVDLAMSICPSLKRVISQARMHGAGPKHAAGLLVSTAFLQPFQLNAIGCRTLFLVLPDAFEPLLENLVTTKPRVINDVALDCQTMLTTVHWRLENTVKVMVDIEPLMVAIGYNRVQPVRPHVQKGCAAVPLVMCAGQSIAFTGLLTTPGWDEEVRVCKEVAATGWHPESVCPASMIALGQELAAQQGLRPWTGKLWAVNEGAIPSIHIPVYPYLDMRRHG